MKFTLTFEGTFKTGGPKADRKHSRRKQFHHQLKRLWAVNSLLKTWKLLDAPPHGMPPEITGISTPAIDVLRKKHGKVGGFEFVPIVSADIAVEAALHFHILRSTASPGHIPDIDNVVKTLADSLKAPQTTDELGSAEPAADEVPFFVLMQDDGLVSKITSSSDELLQPILGKPQIESSDLRVMIEVYIRPNLPTNSNLIFFSDDFEVWNHQWATGVPESVRTWSNSELKARTTQCVLRMRVTAANFRMQQGQWISSHMRNAVLPTEEERIAQWEKATDTRQSQSDEQHIIWNSRLRPIALALMQDLQRRIYGEPPYPTHNHLRAIEHGVLVGVNALEDAAVGLESLIRQLP